VQAKAGRARVSDADPDRQIFPLTIVNVKVDRPPADEGAVALAAGPTFSLRGAERMFSEDLYAELGAAGSSQ
jgi:hypothetical protein